MFSYCAWRIQRFSDFFAIFLYFENIIIYIILVSSLLSSLFKNIMSAFCINMFIGIAGMILAAMDDIFLYLSYYDAALEHHSNFAQFLTTGNYKYITLFSDLLYNSVIFIIVCSFIVLFRKRWDKNGI
ncbi:MAG: hypothetical protein ACK5LT_02505 [Lachnospirales bacterium]